MQPFKVTLEDAKNFAKVWSYKGIAIPMGEEHAQFATDYANVALRSFIEMMQKKVADAKKQAEEATKPLVTLE